MELNFSKILLILFVSILISLIYNHFNPKRLHLLREERVLSWESESIVPSDANSELVSYSGLTENKSNYPSISQKTTESVETFTKPKAIKIDFAYKLFKEGIRFIDSRSAEEFTEGHIKGAVNIPFYGSENYLNVIKSLDKNEIVITYCSSADCDISILSGDELFEMGFKKVYVFVGGYDEWTKYNYPTSK